MEDQNDNIMAFDISSLRADLPQNCRRGLSRYYSGKSRSFTCMADVHCLDDLKKQEHPDAKKRKKHSNKRGIHLPPLSCRRVTSSNQCANLCIGV